jgi:predicted RNA-binding protein with PUA-like domain
VRNYQARNFLRDDIKPGDRVLFYHSAVDPPAVVGVAEVVREGYPDHTAWQKTHPHFDPKSTKEKPTWYMVDIKLEEIFPTPLSLEFLRGQKAMAKMELLRRGSRLSIQPVTKPEFETIVKLAHTRPSGK